MLNTHLAPYYLTLDSGNKLRIHSVDTEAVSSTLDEEFRCGKFISLPIKHAYSDLLYGWKAHNRYTLLSGVGDIGRFYSRSCDQKKDT